MARPKTARDKRPRKTHEVEGEGVEDDEAQTKAWKRPGYKVVMFRAREEVIEVLDGLVDARNAGNALDTIGEPVVTRTTLILEALRAMFLLVDGKWVDPAQLKLKGVK
jgi:hypothetical protein